MTLSLHTVNPAPGSKRPRKRVGRGLGSRGAYSGRGVKGQRARSGGRSGLQLKGLRNIMLRLPKQRGFNSLASKPAVLNLRALAKVFGDGSTVTPQILHTKGLVSDISHGVKILSVGEMTVRVTVKACQVSAAAKAKIEHAGGTVV